MGMTKVESPLECRFLFLHRCAMSILKWSKRLAPPSRKRWTGEMFPSTTQDQIIYSNTISVWPGRFFILASSRCRTLVSKQVLVRIHGTKGLHAVSVSRCLESTSNVTGCHWMSLGSYCSSRTVAGSSVPNYLRGMDLDTCSPLSGRQQLMCPMIARRNSHILEISRIAVISRLQYRWWSRHGPTHLHVLTFAPWDLSMMLSFKADLHILHE